MSAAASFIEQVTRGAVDQVKVEAMALVGSRERGSARQDADIDLVMITSAPAVYLADEQWITTFGEADRVEAEDWGLVQSKRVFYKHGLEVEFGITTTEWANINPVDPGTHRVVREGIRILYD